MSSSGWRNRSVTVGISKELGSWVDVAGVKRSLTLTVFKSYVMYSVFLGDSFKKTLNMQYNFERLCLRQRGAFTCLLELGEGAQQADSLLGLFWGM